jgi:hypothetical protein
MPKTNAAPKKKMTAAEKKKKEDAQERAMLKSVSRELTRTFFR